MDKIKELLKQNEETKTVEELESSRSLQRYEILLSSDSSKLAHTDVLPQI